MESANTTDSTINQFTAVLKTVSEQLTPLLYKIYSDKYKEEVGQIIQIADECVSHKKGQCLTVYYEDIFIYKMLIQMLNKHFNNYGEAVKIVRINPMNNENETALIREFVKDINGSLSNSSESLDKTLENVLKESTDKCLFVIFENFHIYMEKTIKQALIYQLVNILHVKNNLFILLLSEKENISDLYEKRVASRISTNSTQLYFKTGMFKELMNIAFNAESGKEEAKITNSYRGPFYNAITSPNSMEYVNKLETIYSNGPSLLSYVRNVMVDSLCFYKQVQNIESACMKGVESVISRGISVKTSDFLATLPQKYQIILLFIWQNIKDKPEQRIHASKVYESMTDKKYLNEISLQFKVGKATYHRMLNNMHLCGIITIKKEEENESSMQLVYNGCISELHEFLKETKLPGRIEDLAK